MLLLSLILLCPGVRSLLILSILDSSQKHFQHCSLSEMVAHIKQRRVSQMMS